MTHAIRIHEYGDASVMKWEAVDVGDPGPGQIRLAHKAVGLNYIDVYVRTGLYPQPELPFTPGMEAAGVITALGDGVTELAVGDRIAYAGPVGSYAEERLIAADRVVKLPDSIDFETGAAMMLQGMTAQYLLRRTFPVTADTTLLYHAAAGGVGLIVCQWAKALGATIIGTVGSDEKAELAKAHGCTHTINYRTEDFAARVQDLTDGRGVDVVYDSIGKDTFPASLDCLRAMGLWVSFGQASGPVPPVDIGIFGKKGSLFMTRPTLFSYIAQRADLEAISGELMQVVADGTVKVPVNQRFALSDARAAHEALEARQTTGSTVLTVG